MKASRTLLNTSATMTRTIGSMFKCSRVFISLLLLTLLGHVHAVDEMMTGQHKSVFLLRGLLNNDIIQEQDELILNNCLDIMFVPPASSMKERKEELENQLAKGDGTGVKGLYDIPFVGFRDGFTMRNFSNYLASQTISFENNNQMYEFKPTETGNRDAYFGRLADRRWEGTCPKAWEGVHVVFRNETEWSFAHFGCYSDGLHMYFSGRHENLTHDDIQYFINESRFKKN